MQTEYDIIVVGAGPAGVATAVLAARRGRRVLLVDRSSFPRNKLCTHAIMPAGLPVLAELGVLPAIEAAGAQRWYGARLWLNGALFAEPLPRRRVAYSYGLSLRRTLLDEILVDAAAREPRVDVALATSVRALRWSAGCVTGAYLSGSGPCGRAIGAGLVVLAGGRHAHLTRNAGLRTVALPNRHTAYITYLDGVPAEPRPAIEGFYYHGRSASLLPADHGLRVAGVMAPPSSWPKAEVSQRLLAELRRFPPLAVRLQEAQTVGAPVAVRGLRNVWRESARPGLLLIGDAGVQTDPLFGQGIAFALRSGAWAAETACSAGNGGGSETVGRRFAVSRARTLAPRFLAMSVFSLIPPGSLGERLLIESARQSPLTTRLTLRLMLGFGVVSRPAAPRRTLGTWLHEALSG